MPPMRMPKGGPRKAKDPKKTAARLLKYLEQYKLTMILVMENGAISAMGTHDDLLKSSHIYREVYESQTKGGED